MLKQIAVSDLELGMFVHKFEGGWFDHPFWKAKFLIEDDEKLAAIKSSKLRAVVIDTAKGRDVGKPAPAPRPCEARPAPAATSPAAARIRNIKQRTAVQASSTGPVTMAQELANAAAIAEQAREKLGKTIMAARLGKALDVRKVEPVVNDILASVRRNPQAFSGLMRCKLKNERIFRHALSVSALMVALADRMRLNPVEIHNCGLAGLLIDIGVTYLPQVQSSPDPDFRSMPKAVWQSHVMLGYRALANDGELPQLVLDACLYHHERMDGSGFPQGRAGDDIPTVARMAAICDSFEQRLAGYGGHAPMDPAQAVAALRRREGAFDQEILRLFVETVGMYPVGSFVTLASRRIAMVIDEDRKDPLRPVVQAFYSLDTGERILPHRIALAECNDNERILGIADLSGLDLPADEQLRELVFLSAYRNQAQA
ncbi:HD-GYP domain-containing protein [Erythrobacter sp. CCH5-A1]|jgi:HD-GYP domain-containing protein (c-di-GMP phosphodiesterase class II)|uniref:HD-GYP domain-containing protein n=1 Tax=Erythrobacter sp. CCH5-A1 TaxID=1768792 RepID=UPI00083269E7|nr:HD-GYP domain-containing protein [Erythrobacter sp. CCH5-A1]